MRRMFSAAVFILILLWVSAFNPLAQDALPNVSILNLNKQVVSQITDGDSIQLQVMIPQLASEDINVRFVFENDPQTISSCVISSGKSSCTTSLFLSLGWYWEASGVAQNTRVVKAFNPDNTLLGLTNPIMVNPRPVVLVHGFLSNPETWKPYLGANGFLASIGIPGFAVGDGQVPGTLNTGNFADPSGRTNTIAQNAEVLGQYIEGVKQKTGAEMIDLVVHSMGGMISRYYIDRIMKDRDVAQLIMLGSPMGGSDCAVLPAALGFFLPASIEIRESYMTGVFNQQITHRHGIEFYDLGGTAINEAFKSPCTNIPNDTVVALGSINAIQLQASQIDDIHSDLTFSQKAFDDFVKPLLQKTAGTFPTQPDPVSVSPTDSPLQFTRVYTGHVDSGGSTDLTINIESGLTIASFALYDPSRSVTTIVRGASGNVIQLDPQANGFIKVDDPSSMFYLGYGFQNPRPGPWKITVQATDRTPANGSDFAISVYFVGGAKLETRSSTLVPQINDQVWFEANLSLNGQLLNIKEAKAIIKDSNGKTETLIFPSGQQVSVTWKPQTAGTYAVDIVVTGTAPDGSSVERTSFLAVEVQPNTGKLQITFNLVALIAGVGLVLFLISLVVFRGARKLIRHTRT
jgi:pimeloyl-ACP methyl ester carboxylesterase